MNDASAYRQSIEDFMRFCEALGDGVLSVLLFGSLAKGEGRPGRSDIMDAIIVLKDDLLANEEDYYRLVLSFISCCRLLKNTQLPFHPFHYYGKEEAMRLYPIRMIPQWAFAGQTQKLLGDDLRDLIGAEARIYAANNMAYYAERVYTQELVSFLLTPDLDRKRIISAQKCIKRFVRFIPRMACSLLGHEVPEQAALDVLEEYLPHGAGETLRDLYKLARERKEAVLVDAVLTGVKHCLELNEEIHDMLVAKASVDKGASD